MKLGVIAGLIALVAAPAMAQSMNAQQFYERATRLQSKGIMALFSGAEIKALRTEGQAAGDRAAENRRKAIAAERPPRFCPPPGPRTMGDKEFMARLSAIPAAERSRIDLTEALTRMLAIKFPCRV